MYWCVCVFDETANMPVLTPPPTQKSNVVYKWVILFTYCEDTEFPFLCVPLSELENSNFPFSVCIFQK